MTKPTTGKHPVLDIEEFTTSEELEELLFDMNIMRLQALIITERVLGKLHKDTIFRYILKLLKLNNIGLVLSYMVK